MVCSVRTYDTSWHYQPPCRPGGNNWAYRSSSTSQTVVIDLAATQMSFDYIVGAEMDPICIRADTWNYWVVHWNAVMDWIKDELEKRKHEETVMEIEQLLLWAQLYCHTRHADMNLDLNLNLFLYHLAAIGTNEKKMSWITATSHKSHLWRY